MYGLLYEQYTPETWETLKETIHQKGWIGFNVTSPFKEAVYALLDERQPEVEAIQAVNTVAILPQGRWVGYNTDYAAARFLLGEMESVYGGWEGMVILGTGGAARAVALAWASLFPDTPLIFVSRNPRKRPLPFPHPYKLLSYEEFASSAPLQRLLVVQATPVGMFPQALALPPFPVEKLQSTWTVWDLIYNPNPTLFLQRALQRGCAIESGLLLLRKQAEYSLEIWNQLWLSAYKRKAATT